MSEVVVYCAWCGKLHDSSEHLTPEEIERLKGEQNISHGICPACKNKTVEEFKSHTDEIRRKKWQKLISENT